MIKALTADLAMSLYLELPTQESPAPDIESDFQTSSETTEGSRLESSLQRPLGDELQPFYVRG